VTVVSTAGQAISAHINVRGAFWSLVPEGRITRDADIWAATQTVRLGKLGFRNVAVAGFTRIVDGNAVLRAASEVRLSPAWNGA
jgi:hypothetical protein